jgi:hypothetical protein
MNVYKTIEQDHHDTKAQVVSFKDREQWEVSVPGDYDVTRTMTDAVDSDLNNFFSRPIKIASYDWDPAVALSQTFNPWNLFFTNPRVVNRICNFYLMRAKLHVKFVINGNSFYYGRAMASYRPLHNVDEMSKVRAYNTRDLIEKSQRMHVYLNPTTCSGGELELPFVWFADNLNIVTEDYNEMGEIDLDQITYLKSTQDTVEDLNITVFAWATDVVLSIPTNSEPGSIVPQMADEYQGVVSKPASVVAKVAEKLSTVPVLRPYALATQFAADAVAKVASIFGYCKPISLVPDTRIVFKNAGNLAETEGHDLSSKLAVDPKQETTIDSRVVGLNGVDELSVSYLASKESFLTTFQWDDSQAVDTLLFSIEVSPMQFDRYNPGSGDNEYHVTPAAYVSQAFRYWRGSIKYRFMVISSAFHKGRLKFVYEPYKSTTDEYNTNYTEVIDVAETKDFTLQINWAQPEAYRSVSKITTLQERFSTSIFDPSVIFSNGVLHVYVVNELVGPSTTTDIEVAVFHSAGDDIQFAAPHDGHIKDTIFTPQMNVDDGKVDDNPIASSPDMEVVPEQQPSSLRDKVYFADPILSFRNLLKRFQFSTVFFFGGIGTDGSFYRLLYPKHPIYRGFYTSSPDDNDFPAVGTPFNYSHNTLFNWLTPMFLCRRGGLRHKLMLSEYVYTDTATPTSYQRQPLAIASRADDGHLGWEELQYFDNGSPGVQHDALLTMPMGLVGMDGRQPDNNGVVEVEHPYYSQYRFYPARQDDLRKDRSGTANYSKMDRALYSFRSLFAYSHVFLYVAAAEDFTLAYFQNTPVIYPPVAVILP